MSRKRRIYGGEFKTKVVFELLDGEKTVNEIASKYERFFPKAYNYGRNNF